MASNLVTWATASSRDFRPNNSFRRAAGCRTLAGHCCPDCPALECLYRVGSSPASPQAPKGSRQNCQSLAPGRTDHLETRGRSLRRSTRHDATRHRALLRHTNHRGGSRSLRDRSRRSLDVLSHCVRSYCVRNLESVIRQTDSIRSGRTTRSRDFRLRIASCRDWTGRDSH